MTDVLFNNLVIGAVLFSIGAVGFLTRRNLIVMFLSAEMMLQGVALNLVAFGRFHGNYQGQSFTVFVLTVAACEAAVAMVLILMLYHRRHTLDVTVWHDLGEAPVDGQVPAEPPVFEPPPPTPIFPHLPPAGPEPAVVERKAPAHV